MEAGPELDALVAEKVMGWPWRVWHAGKNAGKRFLADPVMEGWMVAQGVEALHEDAFSLVPPFSTDIAAAWQVMENMLAHPNQEMFLAFAREVRFSPHGDLIAPAHLAALRICFAALKAVGISV